MWGGIEKEILTMVKQYLNIYECRVQKQSEMPIKLMSKLFKCDSETEYIFYNENKLKIIIVHSINVMICNL